MYQIRSAVVLHVVCVFVMFVVVTVYLSRFDTTRIRALVEPDVSLVEPGLIADTRFTGPPVALSGGATPTQSIPELTSDLVTFENIDALKAVYPHPLTERTRYMINSCNARVARCL